MNLRILAGHPYIASLWLGSLTLAQKAWRPILAMFLCYYA
jgi:hypothetical protein